MGTPVTALTRRRDHRVRSRALLIVALLILLAGTIAAGTQFGPLAGRSGVGAQEAETRTVGLDEGWNLVGWTGPDTPFLDAIAEIIEQAAVAAAFDAGGQSFRTWNASAPPVLQTLVTLLQGEAVWLRVSEPVDWVQPVVADPDALVLHTGFNLVTWIGPSGLESPDSFAGIAAALNAAFAFDSAVEAFTLFGPSRAAFLNDLTPLVYGDGFWALMDAAATWSQPAAPEPAAVSLPDGSVTLEIPRGALPPGVDASDITISDSPDGPRPIVEGADFLLAVQLEPSGLTFATPVSLHARVRLDPGAMPIPVLLSAERGVEFVPGATIERNGPEGTVVVSFPLAHFSWATLFAELPQMFEVEPHPFGEVMLGQQFIPDAWVTQRDFAFEVTITTPADFVGPAPGSSILEREPSAKQIVRIWPDPDNPFKRTFGWIVDPSPFEVVTGAAQLESAFGVGMNQEHRGAYHLQNAWRCLAPGRLSLRVVGTGSSDSLIQRQSFAQDGRLIADTMRVYRITQELPFSVIPGICLVPPGFFGFISESDSDGGISDEILIGVPMEVLVANPTTPLADADGAHVNVTVWVNGGPRQTLLIRGDPAVVCATPNVCSGLLRAIDAQPGDTVFLVATDRDGNVIAFQLLTVPG